MSLDRNQVLLPVDGSGESMEVVRYVSRAVNLTGSEVVLLSIIDRTSDIFWDTGKDPKANKHLEYMNSWEEYKQQKMCECMDTACGILEQAGIPGFAIRRAVKKKKDGIAADIL